MRIIILGVLTKIIFILVRYLLVECHYKRRVSLVIQDVRVCLELLQEDPDNLGITRFDCIVERTGSLQERQIGLEQQPNGIMVLIPEMDFPVQLWYRIWSRDSDL